MGFEYIIFISAESFAMSSSLPSSSAGGSAAPDLSRSVPSSPRVEVKAAAGGGAASDLSSSVPSSPREEDNAATGSDSNSEIVAPIDPDQELDTQSILHAFNEFPQVSCFERLVAGFLGFWVLFPILREKVHPKILKKILGLITDEHKPPLPQETSRQHLKKPYPAGSRYPHRYQKLLGILKKYGVMGYELRNLTNTIVGLLFGTLNPHLVSNLIEHIQQVDISQENVKTTLVFTLLFLYSVMRNTVLVKKPEQLFSFVQFLLANFNKDNASLIDQLGHPEYEEDFLCDLRIVFGKVLIDFTSIPKGSPLTQAQLAKFQKETDELALPDTEDKTNMSQKLPDDEIPDVLVQAYERQWFALQTVAPRLLLSRGDPLFEFTGDFSKNAHYFLFLTLLTSSCRRSSTIFQKELEKVLRAFQEVKRKQQGMHLFGKGFETPASKLFILIRLVFLDESDDFIERFFEIDSDGKKHVKDSQAIQKCLSALLEKMHEIAEFSQPVHDSMREQITQAFPDVSDVSVAVAGGGVSAHEGPSFRPGKQIKSALKQPSSAPATASGFTMESLRAHTDLQSKLAQQLVTIGLTTPDASMALAAKFNEAGISFLKADLKDIPEKDVVETLQKVSVTLTSVQLKKLMKHVTEE